MNKHILLLLLVFATYFAQAQTTPLTEFTGIKDLKKGLTEAEFYKLYPNALSVVYDTSCKKSGSLINQKATLTYSTYRIPTFNLADIVLKDIIVCFADKGTILYIDLKDQIGVDKFFELFEQKYGKPNITDSYKLSDSKCPGKKDGMKLKTWQNISHAVTIKTSTLSRYNTSCSFEPFSMNEIWFIPEIEFEEMKKADDAAKAANKKRCNAGKLGDF